MKKRNILILLGCILLGIVIFGVYSYNNNTGPGSKHSGDYIVSGEEDETFSVQSHIDVDHKAKQKAITISENILYKESNLETLQEEDWSHVYTILCEGYINICKKTGRSSTFTEKEKSYVLGTIGYMINRIDNNIKSEMIAEHTSLSNIIQKIGIIYDKTSPRGRAGGYGEMYINLGKIDISKNSNELRDVITHELFHLNVKSIKGGSPEKINKTYTEGGKAKFYNNDLSLNIYKAGFKNENTPKENLIFPSQYSKSSTFEFFAEIANLYIHHNAIAKYIASKDPAFGEAYNVLYELFGGKYLGDDTENLTQLLLFKNPLATWRKVYDSTRISRMLKHLYAVEKGYPTQSAVDLYSW